MNLLPLVYEGGYQKRAAYTEYFKPYGVPRGEGDLKQAAWAGRYKLVRNKGYDDELYDLKADPYEHNNLLPGLTPGQERAYEALADYMDAMGK